MLCLALRYLPFEESVRFRQVSKLVKQRVWPDVYKAIELNNALLGAYFVGGRRKGSHESYYVAPKLISEMTSVCEVTFTGLNLTRIFKQKDNEQNSLLECFDSLFSRQHARKISKVKLDRLSTDTIFDVETFCKKFLSRLMQVDELVILKCQPMFIDKMFHTMTDSNFQQGGRQSISILEQGIKQMQRSQSG